MTVEEFNNSQEIKEILDVMVPIKESSTCRLGDIEVWDHDDGSIVMTLEQYLQDAIRYFKFKDFIPSEQKFCDSLILLAAVLNYMHELGNIEIHIGGCDSVKNIKLIGLRVKINIADELVTPRGGYSLYIRVGFPELVSDCYYYESQQGNKKQNKFPVDNFGDNIRSGIENQKQYNSI